MWQLPSVCCHGHSVSLTELYYYCKYNHLFLLHMTAAICFLSWTLCITKRVVSLQKPDSGCCHFDQICDVKNVGMCDRSVRIMPWANLWLLLIGKERTKTVAPLHSSNPKQKIFTLHKFAKIDSDGTIRRSLELDIFAHLIRFQANIGLHLRSPFKKTKTVSVPCPTVQDQTIIMCSRKTALPAKTELLTQ